MVRVASQLIAVAALAQIQRAAAAGTLRGVPDLVELEAVDGGVFVGRQDLTASGNPDDVDCILSDWEPKGECDSKTLTQLFERHIVTSPENDGLRCEALAKTMPCKPVHCQMEPWGEWSGCDEHGFKTRKRGVAVEPQHGGRSCPFAEDKVKCRKQDCRVCEWSAWTCDDTTEKKTRTRHVTRPKELDGEDCPPLTEEEACDPMHCKYDPDSYEAWSECDPITFLKTQRNTVIQEAKYGGKACPVKEEKCPPVNCKYVDKAENDDKFGECKPDDDSEKVWHRHKTYKVEQPAMYGGEDCDPEAGDIAELCEPVDCKYVKDSGEFGACEENKAKEKWYKTKQLDIEAQPRYGGEKCHTNGHGFVEEVCEPVDCDYKTVDASAGEHGHCEEDAESGVWYRTKTLAIKTHPLYGGEQCYENGKGVDKVKCDPVKCEYDTIENSREPTDKCEDDGSGTWYKTITCKVKTPAMYGSEDCDPNDLYVKEKCTKVDCAYDSLANSKKPTDKCEDDGTGKWYKAIKLDVFTEAEYGGEPCHENGNGFDKEFCEPVKCELGPFGAWTECNGDGKKEHWRDLLSPALYGGTCEPQSEEDTCTPQECVVADDEEDDDWGDCQTDGFKYKSLRIKQHPRFGAADCPDETARTRKKPCKVIDCVVGDWSEWGRCNHEGKRKRTREKLLDKKFGGKDCPDLEEVESCDLVPCVLDDWSPWTPCDSDMTRSRTRHVLVETNHGTCESETETEDCKKVDCLVGDWEKWGECTEASYGLHMQSRMRPVLIPPQNGGADCPVLHQTQFCGSNDCHVGDWEPWGQCMHSKKKHTRKCHKKKEGGQECDPEIGQNVQEKPCAQDCVVTEWSDPTMCNAEGKAVSERKVVFPALDGGEECPADLAKEEPCPAVNCVLNGWSHWGECDAATNTRSRHRDVLLEPKHGGTTCPDAESPTRKRTEACTKVDCVMSDWSGWSKCDESSHTQTRTTTKLVEPLNGGKACPPDDELSETRECHKVNCRLSEWSEWSDCVDGKKTRTRSVDEEAKNGGAECPSDRTQEHKCMVNAVAPPRAVAAVV